MTIERETAPGLKGKVKVDKTVVASVILHVLVIGWGLVSFSTKAFVMPEEDTVAVDVISADQLAKVTAGIKSGKKENPKPLVEKVADAKPVEDAVGKVTEKAPVVTETAPPEVKPVEKPVEKKPDPPKPVAENKPKDEPKPIEKKPDPPNVDPIAEALKKKRRSRRRNRRSRPRRHRRSRKSPRNGPSTRPRSRPCSTNASRPGQPRPVKRSIPMPRSAWPRARPRTIRRRGARCFSPRSNAAGRSPMAASRARIPKRLSRSN